MLSSTYSGQIDYYAVLTELGYELKDCGHYWQTNAEYRNGDNKSALQIWKDSGYCKDYVTGDFFRFIELVEKSTDSITASNLVRNNISDTFYKRNKKYYIMQEKTYSEESLSKLLPHYDFYLEKGIKEKILKDYKCGLAMSGKMYQRLVFPVYRRDGKIHGFSGRLMVENDKKPKWKHCGKAKDWFYPYYLDKQVADSMCEKNCVYIVESIGDSLALSNAGFYNNLVSFGLVLSPEFVSKLAALDLGKIVIAFNNDVLSPKNPGRDGAIRSIIKLSKHFDVNTLYMAQLPKNDFGDMNSNEINDFLSKDPSCNDNAASMKDIFNHLDKNKNKYSFSFREEIKRFERKVK